MGRLIETFTFGRNALKRTIDESADAVVNSFAIARSGENLTDLKRTDNGRYNVVRDLISFTGALAREGEVATVTPIGEAFERLRVQNPADAWRWLLTRSLWLFTVPNGTESAVNEAIGAGTSFDFFRRFLGLVVHVSALKGDGRFISYEEICRLYAEDENWRLEPEELFGRLMALRASNPEIRQSPRSFLADLEPEYRIPRDNFAALFGKTFSQTGLFDYRLAGRVRNGIALAARLDAVLQTRVRFSLDHPASYDGLDWDRHLALREGDIPEEVSLLPSDEVTEVEAEEGIEGFVSAMRDDFMEAGLVYSEELLRRFAASLLTRRFLILTGLSGSGKTKLAQAFASWISSRHSPRRRMLSAGDVIEADRVSYRVLASDELAVELENEEGGSRVVLPYALIEEWIDVIEQNGYGRQTPARAIRDTVTATSGFSPQLSSFEAHLKALAFYMMTSPAGTPIRRYEVISVGPDWTSRDASLGYPDALAPDRFIRTTPIIDLILRALADPERPFFLILDEMNLAHVERYFSDFLSVLESDERVYLHNSPKLLGGVPPSVNWPFNLYLAGTVNVDDTTYVFSPKVLDRANCIEFQVTAASMREFLTTPTSIGMERIAGRGERFGRSFVTQARSEFTLEHVRPRMKAELELLFDVLARHTAEFGFRTAADMLRFANAHVALGGPGDDITAALDAQVCQRVLPKLNGSSRHLEPILSSLAAYCYYPRGWEGNVLTNAATILERCRIAGELQDERLRPLSPDTEFSSAPFLSLSFDKILRMLRRLDAEGFTSFAEA